ncbi:MAG: hypothetical protein ACR2J5_08595 [Geodermatophilaceae bacterium]
MRASVEVMRADARAALGRRAQWRRSESQGRRRSRSGARRNAIPMLLVTDLHRTIAVWADWADAALDRIDASEESARQLADEVYGDVATDAITVP